MKWSRLPENSFVKSEEVVAMRLIEPSEGRPGQPTIEIDLVGGDASIVVLANSREELESAFDKLDIMMPGKPKYFSTYARRLNPIENASS